MARTGKIVAGSLALVTAFGGLVLGAAPALAAPPAPQTLYVATTGDDGGGNDCTVASAPCATVQHAVDVAHSGDTVSVAAGTYDEAAILINFDLTVEGASDGITKVDGQGPGIFGVFGINTEGGTTVPKVTFKNLDISGNSKGEGIFAQVADIHVLDSHVDKNAFGGVAASQATVEASNSTFNGNGSDGTNGPSFFKSGLAVFVGAATVDHSTFDGNVGAGILSFPFNILSDSVQRQAVDDLPGSIKLDHSTVSNNAQGGVLGLLASIEISTSTVTGNTGAGVDNSSGTATIDNSTITDTHLIVQNNKVAAAPNVHGAGIVSDRSALNGQLAPSSKSLAVAAGRLRRALPKSVATSSPKIARRIKAAALPIDPSQHQTSVTGSIVANQAGVPDCQGSDPTAIVDGGYNLSSDAANSCTFGAAKHDVVKTDPKLGALGLHGGPTATQVPGKGSAAIDAVPAGAAGCTTDADDQRGVARPQPTGGRCDIGAVELAAKAVVIHPASLPHGTVGKAYRQAITATGGQYPTYVWSLVAGSQLPPGLTFTTKGVLSGTPTKAGTYKLTVSVNDPTLKTYTVVIDDAAAAPAGGSDTPVAQTGPHTASMTTLGGGAVLLGFLVLLAAGMIGRRPGRHRG